MLGDKVSANDKLLKDYAPITGVSIDTRTIKKGEAFIAIKGANFDGHDFIQTALDKGARLVIVSKPITSKSGKVLQLNSSIKNGANSLALLAQSWRKYLDNANTLVIAVAGSNGKTTTRRLIHQTLNTAYSELAKKELKGTQSPKSYNNNLGVALTLLRTRIDDDFVIAEIGTNHPGEIAQLTALAKPDIAVITSIGKEHLEHFGDTNQVAKEQAQLLAKMNNKNFALIEQNALKLLNQNGDWPKDLHVISYSNPSYEPTALGQKISLTKDIQFTLPLFGKHNGQNAKAAIELGRNLGIHDKTIAKHLASAKPAKGRFEPVQKSAVTFINDSYNANPDSVIQSLNTFLSLQHNGRKIIILGDMLELGSQSQQLHEQIGEHLAQIPNSYSDIDRLILIGQMAKHIKTPLLKTWKNKSIETYLDFADTLPEKITSSLSDNDLVLLKASRGMRLERIMQFIVHSS